MNFRPELAAMVIARAVLITSGTYLLGRVLLGVIA